MEEAALRELKEETGFVGKVNFVTPIIAPDPGLSSVKMKLAQIEVDGMFAEAHNPFYLEGSRCSISPTFVITDARRCGGKLKP